MFTLVCRVSAFLCDEGIIAAPISKFLLIQKDSDRLDKKVGGRESSLVVFEVGFSQKKVAFGTLTAYRPEITQSLSHMAPYNFYRRVYI